MSSRIFVVEILGFASREARLLSRIGSLTAGRGRCYEFQEEPRRRPDIVVVDGGNPGALDAWQWAYGSRGIPTVFLSANAEGPQGYRHMKLPLVPTRLLSLLDDITINDLGYLPEVKIGDAQSVAPRACSIAARTDGGLPVLVVDDSVTVRKQMELCLSSLGLAVTLCETGEEAVEVLATKGFRLVFLDVVLPGIDGYQVCKSIKKSRDQKSMPVVMLTSKSSPFDKIKGSLAGCDTYLTKPVENETLTNVLQQYLGHQDTWMPQSPRPPAGGR